MKARYIFLALVLSASLSCSGATEQAANNIATPTPRASLPDNPCELLDAAQMSAVTGLEVTAVNRAPSLLKVVEAQRENREPGPGTICSYQTRSELGAIQIVVPPRAERRAANYWETRTRYLQTFPGAAQPVAGLGTDAWLSGGNALHVLVREDEYFSLSTQMYQPRSREHLVKIAQAVLSRL